MTDEEESRLIDVDALRVGMFIHLELGWMSHPFPLSSFRITSPDQIATLRGLGLKTVRWSPRASTGGGAPSKKRATTATAPSAALPAAAVPADSEENRRRRAELAREREALTVCERQFHEAASECSALMGLVSTAPLEAGDRAQKLARAIIDKMSGSQDMCIRLLPDAMEDQLSHHAVNVGVLALLLGINLRWDTSELVCMAVGALLHDVGKTELPERVRERATCTGDADVRQYMQHVAKGVAAGRRMGLPGDMLQVIGEHHEMADGTGFPAAIRNDAISAASRIVALVNRFDNLCNPAQASTALTPHDALSHILTKCQSQHDSTIVGAFVRRIGIYPPGSVVQLTDGRFAIVVAVNSSQVAIPRVLVHDPSVPSDEAVFIDLDRKGSLGIRRSLKPSALSKAAFAYLQPRQRLAYHCEPARDNKPPDPDAP